MLLLPVTRKPLLARDYSPCGQPLRAEKVSRQGLRRFRDQARQHPVKRQAVPASPVAECGTRFPPTAALGEDGRFVQCISGCVLHRSGLCPLAERVIGQQRGEACVDAGRDARRRVFRRMVFSCVVPDRLNIGCVSDFRV